MAFKDARDEVTDHSEELRTLIAAIRSGAGTMSDVARALELLSGTQKSLSIPD